MQMLTLTQTQTLRVKKAQKSFDLLLMDETYFVSDVNTKLICCYDNCKGIIAVDFLNFRIVAFVIMCVIVCETGSSCI